MVSSPKYIALQGLRTNFANKIHFDGVFSEIDTEQEILTWLEVNIKDTDFLNYEAAEAEFLTIKNQNQVVVSENLQFYIEIKSQIMAKDLLYQLVYQTTTSSDPNPCAIACGNSLNSQLSDLTASYTYAVANAFNKIDSSPSSVSSFSDTANALSYAYTQAKESLQISYMGCLQSCA